MLVSVTPPQVHLLLFFLSSLFPPHHSLTISFLLPTLSFFSLSLLTPSLSHTPPPPSPSLGSELCSRGASVRWRLRTVSRFRRRHAAGVRQHDPGPHLRHNISRVESRGHLLLRLIQTTWLASSRTGGARTSAQLQCDRGKRGIKFGLWFYLEWFLQQLTPNIL